MFRYVIRCTGIYISETTQRNNMYQKLVTKSLRLAMKLVRSVFLRKSQEQYISNPSSDSSSARKIIRKIYKTLVISSLIECYRVRPKRFNRNIYLSLRLTFGSLNKLLSMGLPMLPSLVLLVRLTPL
jgi:hypothetical protein